MNNLVILFHCDLLQIYWVSKSIILSYHSYVQTFHLNQFKKQQSKLINSEKIL